MGVVMFYHLARSSAEETVAKLADRAMTQGWRLMARASTPAALDRLDSWLWLHPEDGFLPHGVEGGPNDADQPLLLGQGAAINGAKGVFLLGALPVDPDEARAMERIWLLFDAADQEQLAAARLQWKAVTAAGLPAQYWSEETGRWQMKAESKAAV
jgi:DNA polymerase-3 subunit chi